MWAKSGDDGEIWVKVIEKAFSKLISGSENRPRCLDSSVWLYLAAMTGWTEFRDTVSPEELTLSHLRTLLKRKHRAVIAGTRVEQCGLTENHGYSVVGISSNDDVRLYNPHGRYETVSFDVFKDCLRYFYAYGPGQL